MTGTPPIVDVNEVVEALRPMLSRAFGEQVDLVYDLRAQLRVTATVDEVQRAVLELALDANDLGPPERAVAIATRDRAGLWVELSMAWSGATRTPAAAPRLRAAAEVVRRNGGRFEVQCSGSETTVRLLLPVAGGPS